MGDKLKTINQLARCPQCRCIDEPCVDYIQVKEEAIKWFKHLESDHKTLSGKYYDYYYPPNILKDFFNLTEEDLK